MSIRLLSPQISRQIAAGEVVERPASVVKEIVENSLDAGATNIDVNIKQGGLKLIRIHDNGCGIKKDELILALKRHATSKIATVKDLESIISFGFRGEALASISSVSRLTLISRTKDQSNAWQIYGEGVYNLLNIKPIAHPIGTTLEVLDIFYNVPARRKFMCTEKTEFIHIDEVIRRVALVRFDITIVLTHNDKIIRKYRAISEENQLEKRLIAVCGTEFFSNLLKVSYYQDKLDLNGWVINPTTVKKIYPMQYFYVNGRVIRDRVINHAVRQAYQDKIGDQQQPSYILYLKIEPYQVDVNVHPMKNKVRFYQTRLVHDFVYQAVLNALQKNQNNRPFKITTKTPMTYLSLEKHEVARDNLYNQFESLSNIYCSGYPYKSLLKYEKNEEAFTEAFLKNSSIANNYVNNVELSHPTSQIVSGQNMYSVGRVLSVIKERFALIENINCLILIALPIAERYLKQAQLDPENKILKNCYLLTPEKILMSQSDIFIASKYIAILRIMSFKFMIKKNYIILHAIPVLLYEKNFKKIILKMIKYLGSQEELISASKIAQWLGRELVSKNQKWNYLQTISLIAEIEKICPYLIKSPPSALLQKICLKSAMNALNCD